MSKDENKILTVDDLLAKMRQGVKSVHEIRLRDLVVPVRVLSVEECNKIRRAAISKMATTIGADETDRNLEIQRQTLIWASNINVAPLLSEALVLKLSLDEIQYLYGEYMRVMDSVNPSLESLEPAQFRAIVDALKKNTISGKDCSLLQLRAICTAYVDLILRVETPDSQPAN